MDHDFQNRNEMESLDSNYHKQYDTDDVPLSAYLPSKSEATNVLSSSPGDNNYFNQLMGQMQLMQYSQLQAQISSSKKSDGFSLNISKDIFRWLILFVFILILVWLLLRYKDQSSQGIRQNPIKKLKRNKKRSLLPSLDENLSSSMLDSDDLQALDELSIDG